MSVPHPYTVGSLAARDARFLTRSPGVADIERLFPSPSSPGKGRIAVEGGVSVVAGPGVGKSSLLANLAWQLDANRHLATALVSLPDGADHPGENGFYTFLGELVRRLRTALRASSRVLDPAFERVAAVLAEEPAWDAAGDAAGSARAMTPRGVERWIAGLGAAAVRTPGVCLLFDDVDHVCATAWKSAFVAALRFTFQTSAGITPVYGLWTLFADESLAGSNYFRNVTRPVFLEPMSSAPASPSGRPSERRALVDLGLPTLPAAAAERVFQLVGGHPQLLHRALADVCEHVDDVASAAKLDAGRIDEIFRGPVGDAQRAMARALLARTPALPVALRELARGASGTRPLARGLLATGLVDRDSHGRPLVPLRVAEVL